MSSKYCPFLEDRGSGWSINYYCQITGEKITTGYEPYKSYCGNYENYGDVGWGHCPRRKGGQSQGSSSGCFLTSACAEAMGLPDDCHELTVLRRFRDGWLREADGGEDAVSEYYRIAPSIVESIRAREDSKAVFERIYREMVLPCVKMIENGQNREAFALYRSYTDDLAKTYIGA